MTDHTDRDEILGRALRDLEVPDHRPGFFDDVLDLLEGEATERRPRRLRLVVPLAAAAAVLAVLAGVLVGGPRNTVASAAEVKARVDEAWSGAQSFQGTLVIAHADPGRDGAVDALRWQFAVTARGDFRLTGVDRDEDIAYDAATGTERSVFDAGTEGVLAAEVTGVAPGPPDQGPSEWILDRELGAAVRALLAAPDPEISVEETSHEDRDAWLVTLPVPPNMIEPDLSPDRLEVTVDRGTGMAVRVVQSRGGRFLQELRLEDLEVDVEMSPDAFTVVFPPGAEVVRRDLGFRRMDLDEAVRRAGYRPPVPQRLPDGYRLAEVAFAGEGHVTGTEGMNPPGERVVSMVWRRGLDRVILTTRLRGPHEWNDPLGAGEGDVLEAETVTIRGGALDGLEAELAVDSRVVPHLWALTDDLVLTLSGHLTRDEIRDAANSLFPSRG